MSDVKDKPDISRVVFAGHLFGQPGGVKQHSSASPKKPTQQLPPRPPFLPLSQQPEKVQRLIYRYAKGWFLRNHATKAEVSKMLQSAIRDLNAHRPDTDQYKVPALKTLCFFIDEGLNAYLRRGFAVQPEAHRHGADATVVRLRETPPNLPPPK